MSNGSKYLVKVDPTANNNKYYRMTDNENGTFTTQNGRIGNPKSQSTTYPISRWDEKYREKLSDKKGYTDLTHLVADVVVTRQNNEYVPISNRVISEIVQRLQSFAKQAVSENYTISSDSVTQAMVDEAQIRLNNLVNSVSVESFNTILVDLFQIIPRKMRKVKDYLANSDKNFGEIVQREQDLLDVMRGQVIQQSVESGDDEIKPLHNQTILDIMGLRFEEVDIEDIAKIKDLMKNDSYKYINAWKVTNLKTQQKFEGYNKLKNIKDTKLFFHGSSNCNWWSIINMGLMLNPNAVITGKMWGFGLYTSPDFDKSRGYTSISGSRWANGNESTGFIALMDVSYGNPYNAYSFDNKYSRLTYEGLQTLGSYDSVHAHGGTGMLRKDEVIVYQENQITIKYLIEIK